MYDLIEGNVLPRKTVLIKEKLFVRLGELKLYEKAAN